MLLYWHGYWNKQDEIVSPKCHKTEVLATIRVV